MQNYLTFIFNPGQYRELSHKLSAKLVVIMYLISSLIAIAVQLVLTLVQDAGVYEEAFGRGASGPLFVIVLTLVSFVVGLFFSTLIYSFYAVFTQMLIDSTTEKPTFKEVLRLYIFSYMPSIILGFLGSLLSLIFVPFISVPAITLVYSLLTVILGCISLVAFFWQFYLLIAGIQSKYNTTTGNAVVAGCLPQLVVTICMVVIAFVAIIGIFGLVSAAYY